MKLNKAKGRDNIPIELFKHCWDIVVHDIIRMFEHFHIGMLGVHCAGIKL
jgi:hypothetical protein